MDLKKIRKQKGWTQQDLADKIGMHRVSINRMETGTQKVSKRTELAIKELV